MYDYSRIADNELWQLLRNGDERAYESMYKAHAKALHRYGSRFELDDAQVSDCLHDLFVDIWQKKTQLTPQISSIRYYLIIALRRRITRVMAQQKKTILSDMFTEEHLNFDFEPAHDMRLIENEHITEQHIQLNNALNQLPPRQREALYLRFYQDLSYQEVASILNVEQQSAYNIIFRGVEALRKLMMY
jgi:RNA polymerase sigma factor (sigma-70 family)